jgi:hypothetical protein
VGFEEIFFNDAFDIPRWHRVEVEDVENRYSEGFLQEIVLSVLRFIAADNLFHLVFQMELDFL